ncbi:hypothetical protein SDC9_78472 [bioreactor metagenome]|uniref:Uncharacterized protein n=1 Tax=bioreactor metagenome TaxID=1076179 RepID=A0A644YTL0_9ZZZZ|nr:hypothetical protein [Candidatus Metalachnospira sp.]
MKFKRLLPAAIAASLVLSSQTAYAYTGTSAELTDVSGSEESDIICFWSNTSTVVSDLTIKNGVAKPSAVVIASYESADISGELYLQKKVGSRWERVKTWDISGTGSISTQKSYTIISGETYRSRVVIDVEYNGHSEHIYANSGSVTAS